jgi:hypothetical protein
MATKPSKSAASISTIPRLVIPCCRQQSLNCRSRTAHKRIRDDRPEKDNITGMPSGTISEIPQAT